MKYFFQKTTFILVIISALFVISQYSCKTNGKGKEQTFVEYLHPLPEALLPLIDSYTSGVIGDGDPVMVRFKNTDTLKVKYGEELASKLFTFEPPLKGNAYWIDANTIGFKYSKIDSEKQYSCVFHVGLLTQEPLKEVLEFGFGVRRQNFSIALLEPLYKSAEKMDCNIRVAFANAIGSEDAVRIFDQLFRDQYHVETNFVGGNTYDFFIQDIDRGSSEKGLEIKLDGKPVESETKIKRALTVAAKDIFEVAQIETDRVNGVVTLYFTQPLKANQNFDGFVDFNREIGYRMTAEDNKLVLYFETSNMSNYELQDMEVAVKRGLRSDNGMVFPNDAEFEFDLTENKPMVRWTNSGVIIPDVKDATIYFDAVCLNFVTFKIVRVFDENLLSYMQDNSLNETYEVRKAGRLEKKIRIQLDNPVPTQWKTFPIELSNYVEVKPGALYQLILDFGPEDYTFASEQMKKHITEYNDADYWDGQNYRMKEYIYEGEWNDPNGFYYYNDVEVRKNVMVTDLGVTAKMGCNDRIDVFAFSISNASPQSGVNVKAYNYQKQEIASGKTDSKGHVLLECANRPAFVMAADGGSKSVIKVENGNSLSYSKFDVGGESVAQGVAGFAYSNRGVWRPGDDLQINLMLNDIEGGLPENYPVVMEVYDAGNSLYSRQSNLKGLNGIYCFKVPTNPSDETGLWQARFKVGSAVITYPVRVETVKPNRLEINFDLPNVVSLTRSEKVELRSKWLNGMNATGLKADVEVNIRQGVTSFEKFKDYTFVNISESFASESYTLFSGPLNDKGVAKVGFDPLEDLSSSQMLNATFVTKVYEAGGDFSITSSSAKLSPCSSYVGVRKPEPTSKYGYYYDTGKDWKFDVAIVNEDGSQNHNATTIAYNLYRLDSYWWWSSEDSYSLQRYVSGNYKKPVQHGTLSCSGTTSLTFNVADKDWGYYLLVVEDMNSENVFADVIEFDWGAATLHSSSASGAPAHLFMKATQDAYQVGESIVVTFPANEKAKALVTVEANDRVLDHFIVDRLGTEGRIEIPATDEMIPNVYVYVSLLQPHDADNDLPIRLYGVVSVKVENGKLHLKPVINIPETSPTNKKLEVKVGETNGKPMTYTLAVVDEGILGLTNFSTPDPYKYFNSKQALKVRTWDNYDWVIDVFTGELGAVYAVGGDGLLNQEVMLDKRFKAYAVTLGPFELKAGAANTHEIVVPQCSGSLRFMVVANGNNKSFGSVEKSMKVIDPITLYVSAPRVVAPGDELDLNVQVLSQALKGKNANVVIENKNFEAVGTLPSSVKISQEGEGLVTMRVKVPKTLGSALLKVTVKGGGYEAVSETTIPIRMPYSERRQVLRKELDPNSVTDLSLDLQGLQGSQSGKVLVASLIPVDLFGRLDYLTSYPHGCLEQIVSRALPQLYLNYLVQLPADEMSELRNNIQSAISNLKAYQRSDNSMSLWAGGSYVDPWSEIYALHFLAEANGQGFDVPQHFLQALVSHQTDIAKNWNNNPDFKQGETIQAYRLFVLALAGSPQMGAMNRFKEITMNYSLTKSLVAAAFALTGKTTIAQKLLPSPDVAEVQSDYLSSCGSAIRDKAFSTYTLMLCKADQQQIQQYVNEICDVLNSDAWLGTQTTAFALFTLGKYAEINKIENTEINTVLRCNGDEKALATNMNSVTSSFVPVIGTNSIEVNNKTDQKLTATVFTKASVAEYDVQEGGSQIGMSVQYVDNKGVAVYPSSLPGGTDFKAKITVKNTSANYLGNLVLSYYLPSGWEIVNDRLMGNGEDADANHVDVRDDRAYFYFNLSSGREKTFVLHLNATYKGNYTVPGIHCEAMYDNAVYYVIPAAKVEVK